nr:Ig-like domain-containing protein [uncultured Allomuricauda sp.]
MKNIYLVFVTLFTLIVFSCSSDSEEPEPEPDTTAPTISFNIAGFSNPGSEPIVASNQIEININAQDAGGVAKVEAFIDNEKVGEDTTAPYQIVIDISGFASKITQTAKFKDYTLKIVVTDTSGNTSSQEQVINIDNELPVITLVSLEPGTIINGDTNMVTFDTSDNEGLSTVKTYLNNNLLTEIIDANYQVNIDTQQLEDGENVLKIEATDLAENTVTFEVAFISDNTGPGIKFESLVEEQIIHETTSLNPIVTDALSAIQSVEILFANQSLIVLEGSDNHTFDLNPDNLPTGTGILAIKATDELLNETIIEIPLEIHRKLIGINFPLDFLQNDWDSLYVFASGMNGNLLAVERVYNDTERVVLTTPEEVDSESEFALTFANNIVGADGNHSDLATILNLKPSSGDTYEINIRVAPKFVDQGITSIPAPIQDGSGAIVLNASGYGYGGSSNSNSELNLFRSTNTASMANTNEIYFSLWNLNLSTHSHALVQIEDLDSLVLDSDALSSEGVENKTSLLIRYDGADVSHFLMQVFGYLNEDDYQNDIFHQVSSRGGGMDPPYIIPYATNSIFSQYKYEVVIDDYYTLRTGEPLSSFTTKDWSIDYAFSNNVISITSSGSDHNVGKILMRGSSWPPPQIDGKYVTYTWNLVFDSQNTDEVFLPEIPDEIKSWDFNQFYENNNLEVAQAEVKAYENISSYSEYFHQILKNNEFSFTVSPKMESKFKNHLGESIHLKSKHFIID